MGSSKRWSYAEILDVPFVFASNGDGFIFHDRTGISDPIERELYLANSHLQKNSDSATGLGRDSLGMTRISSVSPTTRALTERSLDYYHRIDVQATLEGGCRAGPRWRCASLG